MEKRIYNGSRFLFIRPGNKPVKIEKTYGGKTETTEITEPTIFSKYNAKVVVGGFQHFNPVDSTALKLGAVVTDRKVYRPGDKIACFVFIPQKPESKFAMMIMKNAQDFLKEDIETDEKGVYSNTFEGLEDGSYSISIKTDELKNIECSFIVAAHTLSFMRASLSSHTYKMGEMHFRLSAIMGDIPYAGTVKAGLWCDYCRAVVLEEDMESKEGTVEGKFKLEGHTGPFSLVLTTPEGESATIFIPGSRSDVRETVRLSEMGEIILGSLLPSDNVPSRNRGIYYGSTGAETCPVTLDEMVDEKAVLRVNTAIDHLVINIFSPLHDTFQEIEQRDVRRGSVIELNPPHPLSILSVGAMGKDCFETFSLLMKPEKMEIEISAPFIAKPGEEIEISIKSNRSGRLMLIVADSRLERENPFDKLTEEIFKNIKSNLSRMKSGKIEEMPPPVTPSSRHHSGRPRLINAALNLIDDFASGTMMAGMTSSFAKPKIMRMMRMSGQSLDDMNILSMEMSQAEMEVSDNPSTSRMDFPEVVLAEMLDFDEKIIRKVKLGEQIGSFTIFAFLMDVMDYISESKQVEVFQDVYVELDVPALMSPGDEIMGKAYAKCREKGNLSILTSITRIEKEVKKSGTYEIAIKSAGEVMAELATPQGKDTVSRTIGIPGEKKSPFLR